MNAGASFYYFPLGRLFPIVAVFHDCALECLIILRQGLPRMP